VWPDNLGYRMLDYTSSIAHIFYSIYYRALRMESVLSWNRIDLKVTARCAALRVSPYIPSLKNLGFTGCFYKSHFSPDETYVAARLAPTRYPYLQRATIDPGNAAGR
jgi:hypothetical protein